VGRFLATGSQMENDLLSSSDGEEEGKYSEQLKLLKVDNEEFEEKEHEKYQRLLMSPLPRLPHEYH
jgi:hypothetical protein